MRYILFLTVFLSLYGGLHLYWYARLRSAFALRPALNLVCLVLMLSLLLAPIATRFLERNQLELPARWVAYIGYVWMGYLFLFFASGIVVEGYRLLIALATRLFAIGSTLQVSPRYAFVIPCVAALCITGVGYYTALAIRAEKIVLPTSKLDRAVGRLKIVQISDVHLGLIVRAHRLQRIAKVIAAEKPDVLVSTGDLVDGQLDHLSGLTGELRKIPTRYGKYAVTGNHEFYAGLDAALKITRAAGFKILRGEGLNIPGVISIAGVDDPTGRRWGRVRPVSERALRSSLPDNQFALLLKHQPRLANASQGLFDLQLSGHTHKGQIFPFGLIVKYFFPFDSGLFTLADHTHLYVSRGTGTWGPPIRFLSPPEVTVIELVSTSG